MVESVPNLYVHFPFCRRKCTYCALYSKVGVSDGARAEYVERVVRCLDMPRGTFSTIYFGGGSPALCALKPIFEALAPHLTDETEFTVELHPLDATEEKLAELKAGGVNRISMGVQSLNDETLVAMGRGYTVREAMEAFARVKKYFVNAGIDLIVGYPGDVRPWETSTLRAFELTHCSVYSLQNERNLKGVPSDEWTLDRLGEVAAQLEELGLERYEISNYAKKGFECRHNLATWRGEDYFGIGEGAFGRVGRMRTKNWWGGEDAEQVEEQEDFVERRIFRLRTREGLDAAERPDWMRILDEFVKEGLLSRDNTTYRLTARGREVCDTILAELV